MKIFVRTIKNINRKNYLENSENRKKLKIKISCHLKIDKNSGIKLKNQNTIYFEQIKLNSKYFNSFQNLEKFNNFKNPFKLHLDTRFLTKEILYECYPLNQTFFSLSVYSIEQLGSVFFSALCLKQNKLYYELELFKKLSFPFIILTNIVVLKHLVQDFELLLNIERNSKKFFVKKRNKKGYDDSIPQTFHRIFFIEGLTSEIPIIFDRLRREFLFKKKKIFLFRITSSHIFFLCARDKLWLKELPLKNRFMFEIQKIIKKTTLIKYSKISKNAQTIKLQKKRLPTRIKFNNLDKENLIKQFDFDYLKISENIQEILNQFQIFDKISCSLFISSTYLPKINQILMTLKFKKLMIKIFQIENILKLDFLSLIEILSDLKIENQKLILMIGTPNDIPGFNFFFSILSLPKIQCIKILSGFKKFQKKNTKLFIIKKSFEKFSFYFPIVNFTHLKGLYYYPCIEKSFLDINFGFQKKIPKRFFKIYGIINTVKNITYDELEDKFSFFHQISRILNRKTQNKFFSIFFFFFFFTISKEKFISKRFSSGKKLKKVLFFLIFFIPRDIINNA
jgi:hypothetical protein